jgi:hypothetical protein
VAFAVFDKDTPAFVLTKQIRCSLVVFETWDIDSGFHLLSLGLFSKRLFTMAMVATKITWSFYFTMDGE